MERRAIYTNRNEDDLVKSGQEWNFHGEETGEHLHSLHPYPAKFIPQIPRKAILTYTEKRDLVYDPFMGCGTTLLEASLLGRESVGTDNNSVAVLVSRAKTQTYTKADIKALEDFLNEISSALPKPDQALIPKNDNFLYWFNKDVLRRLSSFKKLILTKPEPIQTMLMAIFSSIIVRVSYQDSDTRYAKTDRIVNPKDVDRAFSNKLKEVISYLPEIPMKQRAEVKPILADSRAVPFIKSGSVSLVVTSPPYLNAFDYHKYHRQRLHWVGGDIDFARDIEIGSHDEFTRPNASPKQYFTDMNQCFKEWSRVLKKKGYCLIVVGDAIVNKKSVSVADTFIDLMRENSFVVADHWIRELHATKRAFNVLTSRINREHVLLFQKQ